MQVKYLISIFVVGGLILSAYLRFRSVTPTVVEVPPDDSQVCSAKSEGCAPEVSRTSAIPQPLAAAKPLAKAKPSEKGPELGVLDAPWVQQLNDLMRDRRFEAALALMNSVLQTDPKNEQALLGVARIYAFGLNDPLKAESYLKRILDRNPESPEALDELVSLAPGPHEGSQLLKRLYEAHPDSPNIAASYGRWLVGQGKGGEAIAMLERAAQTERHAEGALRSIADAHFQMGDPGKAAETFGRLVAMQEASVIEGQRRGFDMSHLEEQITENQVAQAASLLEARQSERAETLLRQVAQRSPNHPALESLLSRARSGR